MHACTRSLTLGLVVCLGLLFIGCAEQNAKPATREGITPPVAGQKSTTPKPDNLPEASPPDILPRTYMAAGRFHESQGHYARALEQYQQAVASDPRHVEALNRLGIVLDRMGRFKEADDAFKRGMAIAPDAAYLHNNLAFSYMTQARWTEAEAELTQAIQLKPDFLRARVNLGMVLAQRDRFDEAMVHFEAVLTKADAHYNMGLMYQSKRKLPEAARSFHLALQANPKLVAAQKRLEMLPPEAAKAGKEMATAIASPAPEPVVASVTPTTRPEAEVKTPANLPELAKPVHVVDAAAAASEPKADEVQAAVRARRASEGHQAPEEPAGEEPVNAAVSTENTEAADLMQAPEVLAEVTTRPESVDTSEVADKSADESVTDFPSGEGNQERETEEDSTSPEREARGSDAATQPSETDEPAESSETESDSEGTDVSHAGTQEQAGLVTSMLSGLAHGAGTARAGVASVFTKVKTVGRQVISSIRTADPYAEFLRMASPLALNVPRAQAGVRPFDLTAATTAPAE